jgi:hypothetical protein
VEAAVGGDFKYGVTANLTADLTFNTDFAQVEVDEQQVNLTRFSLFFPEKRDFFLEGRGIFDFGRGGPGQGNGGDTPYLFYSRRIGLNRGRVVPIDVGGRLTGKVGGYSVGFMNIQAGDEEASGTEPTNFTVLRVKREILRRSTIGAMVTNRSVSTLDPGSNQAYGVDAAFSFFQNVAAGAYYARTKSATPENGPAAADPDDESYQAKFGWTPDRYGVELEYLKVGDDFNPEVGFVRRDNFRRSYASFRFSPRPASIAAVRKFTFEGDVEYFVNDGGAVETRRQSGRFNTELETSDQATIEASDNYELLLAPFVVGGRVAVPAGGYDFRDVTFSYQMGAQRRVSGTFSVQLGEFYDGTIRSYSYTGGRVGVTKQFSFEPAVIVNQLKLPAGDVTTRLLRTRVDYGFSPRMFVSALLQHNSIDDSFSSNLRFRWEYIPGSELFLVWTDEHDTGPRGLGLRNRAFVVKVTRLLRF